MAPPSLQGLNVVHPAHPADGDSQDLLSGPLYPEFNAQLDMWTNLAFENDEPARDDGKGKKKLAEREEEEERDDTLSSAGSGEGAAAIRDGHVNVVTGRDLPFATPTPTPAAGPTSGPVFDFNTFLAGFGIDSFAAPPVAHSQSITPSLAQLLALHTAQGGSPYPPPPASLTARERAAEPAGAPAAKRARTRKSSVSSSLDSPAGDYRDDTPGPNTSTPLSAAEDKRRRNTAASARFRLKKKEREAALEGKAKELEVRVNELERECEGLRRENGWLKGLVVGATGAAQQPVSVGIVPGAGAKRPRDEVDP